MEIIYSQVTPAEYKCGKCGAIGCKLWRDYGERLVVTSLLCASCAAESQKKDISDIDADGLRRCEFGGRTNQIGWYIPAVPTEDFSGYWGIMSIPEIAYGWWRNLPTHPEQLNAQPVA